MSTADLCCLLQGLHGEGQVATLAQVVIVHALSHLGDGIIARQTLPVQSCSMPNQCRLQPCKQARARVLLACTMFYLRVSSVSPNRTRIHQTVHHRLLRSTPLPLCNAYPFPEPTNNPVHYTAGKAQHVTSGHLQ